MATENTCRTFMKPIDMVSLNELIKQVYCNDRNNITEELQNTLINIENSDFALKYVDRIISEALYPCTRFFGLQIIELALSEKKI